LDRRGVVAGTLEEFLHNISYIPAHTLAFTSTYSLFLRILLDFQHSLTKESAMGLTLDEGCAGDSDDVVSACRQ
jgi:hypothetical protein